MRLTKQDFDQLDELITKIGFGSYYDLIEIIKMTITNLEPTAHQIINKEDNLYDLIIIMLEISKKRKEARWEREGSP